MPDHSGAPGVPPTALVVLAEGAEEMEAIIVVDVLRRGGVEVTLAGLDGAAAVTCSRGVRVVPDVVLADVQARDFDVVVLPGGGEGTRRLAESAAIGALLRTQDEAQRLVGAICAAPAALARHGVGAGRTMTSHPALAEPVGAHANRVDEPVVQDGHFVTSQGPGTSFAFALTLLERLRGADVAASVRAPMMLG